MPPRPKISTKVDSPIEVDLDSRVRLLKTQLSDVNIVLATKRFTAIRNEFHANYTQLTSLDVILLNQIKIKIMQDIIAKDF